MNRAKPIYTTSIIGLSKNAGKTTLLNYLIQKKQQYLKLGVASIGVDGEREDLITGRAKPAIKIPEGAIVATTASGLQGGTASFRILQQLNYSTALGSVFLAEAVSGGTVKLAGIPSAEQIMEVIAKLEKVQVDEFLLDGAFDRFAGANPMIADQVYLVIGASLHHDQNLFWKTVEERIQHFFYDPLTDPVIIARIKDPNNNRLDNENWFYLSGILTDNILSKLIKENKASKIILENGLKNFAKREIVTKWRKMGGEINVLYPIQIVGIAVNPYSPSGYSFPINEMKARVREIFMKYTKGDIQIIDAWRDK